MGFTLIVVPLVGLAQDILRKLSIDYKNRVPYGYYPSDFTGRGIKKLYQVRFVVISVESVLANIAQLKSLALSGLLKRVIIDEAHLLLTSSHFRGCCERPFHPQYPRLPHPLSQWDVVSQVGRRAHVEVGHC